MTLPSRLEYVSLPRWARVAFAVRCARRVSGLYDLWAGSTDGFKSTLANALEQAMLAAAKGQSLHYNADRIRMVLMSTRQSKPAYYAVRAIQDAVAMAGEFDINESLSLCEQVAKSTHKAFQDYIYGNSNDYRLAKAEAGLLAKEIRKDFDAIVEAAGERGWSDDTPVMLDQLALSSIDFFAVNAHGVAIDEETIY